MTRWKKLLLVLVLKKYMQNENIVAQQPVNMKRHEHGKPNLERLPVSCKNSLHPFALLSDWFK